MKIYKVYSQCMMGFESDIEYKKSIDKATQYFNDQQIATYKYKDSTNA